MGAEVELDVGSDTGTLRSESGRHPNLRVRGAGVLFALIVAAAACADPPKAPADAGASVAEAAEALVAGAPLPSRFETVGIADALAVASLRERDANDSTGRSPEGARLARLAAELRVRLFRFDQVPTDAREAIELYAEAARLSAGAE